MMTKDELDSKIEILINKYGAGKWLQIWMELQYKTPQYIRQRYIRTIKFKEISSKFSVQENFLLLEKFEEYGNKWKRLSTFFINRSEIQIKNHFHAYIKVKFFFKHKDLIHKYPNVIGYILDSTFGITEEQKEELRNINNSNIDNSQKSIWQKNSISNTKFKSIKNLCLQKIIDKTKPMKAKSQDKIFFLKRCSTTSFDESLSVYSNSNLERQQQYEQSEFTSNSYGSFSDYDSLFDETIFKNCGVY